MSIKNRQENKDSHKISDKQKKGTELEEYCLNILKEWIEKQSYAFDIKRADPCPVDIILKPIKDNLNIFEEVQGEHTIYNAKHEFANCYFFECKDYTKPVSLEKIAKSILVAQRYTPYSMTIVTTSPLSLQSLDYINFFITQNSHFYTNFTTWSPKKETITSTTLHSEASKGEATMKFWNIDAFSMQIEYLFSKIHVTATSPDQYLKTRPIRILFRSLVCPPEGKRLKKLTEAFLLSSYPHVDTPLCALRLVHHKDNAHIYLEGHVDGALLSTGVAYHKWKLKLCFGKNNEALCHLSTLPAITISSYTPELPDFRQQKAQRSYEDWRKSGLPIMVVTGEGGIGKSYLCHKVCLSAAQEGFTTISVSALDGSELDFVARLA